MAKTICVPTWKLLFLATVLLLPTAIANGQSTDNEQSHSTSVAGMVKLLQFEEMLINNLDDYATELETKLNVVRSYVDRMQKESTKALEDTERYLGNPLNAFSVIRRMHQDWIKWQQYLEQPVGVEQAEFVKQQAQYLPTATDLQEAADALDRIHHTYSIEVSDIVRGVLNGKKYNATLSPLDTYALGNYNFDEQNFSHASRWIYETINSLSESEGLPVPLALDRAEVLHVYAEALIKMNRYADARSVLHTASTLKKDNLKLLLRKSEVETLIRTNPNNETEQLTPTPVTSYQRGCRGLYSTQSNLHCVYNSTNSPFLRLAPLKMELLSLEPYMVLYHDVISPSEIRELQSLAVPELKRASVLSRTTGQNEIVKTRTSKVAWLLDTLNPLTIRLNKRISDMTNFEIYGSEMLQVMNYGLGGHYATHYDFFNLTATAANSSKNGDRIATVLFYLTDVEQGGATIFTKIEKAVVPKKGTAVVWYNLQHDGTGNPLTLHAACPVIVGSKWVCNKWIREREQVFKRPCLLEKP